MLQGLQISQRASRYLNLRPGKAFLQVCLPSMHTLVGKSLGEALFISETYSGSGDEEL